MIRPLPGENENAEPEGETRIGSVHVAGVQRHRRGAGVLNRYAERRIQRSFHTVRLGLLTGSPPTVTPFPTGQSLADGVGVTYLDGQGNFTALDFAMRDGSPNVPAGTPGLTPDGFASATGTYHVNPDCTGAGAMSQPNLTTTFVLVVGDHGRTNREVGTSLHVAAIPGNPDCVSGCDLAAQVTQEGQKIFGGR
jgi:hypothetical protein